MMLNDTLSVESNGTSNGTTNGTANDTLPNRYPGYRASWDDCGGVGASDAWRMRSIAAKIHGWAKPRPFRRNAAQDAGKVHPSGLIPGPGSKRVYPNAGVHAAAKSGLDTAASTLR